MLSGNKLVSLPKEMENCRELELIRLASNSFHSVPAWLFNLPKLSWIALSGNPVSVSSAASSASASALVADYADFIVKVITRNLLRLVAFARMTICYVLLVKDKIGEGTSGVVSRAHWISKNQEVALKIFKSVSTSDGDPKEEMRSSLHVGNHPNTPAVLGSVQDYDVRSR